MTARDTANTTNDKVDHVKGVGFYPEFKALWHLKALGVVDDLITYDSAEWQKADGKPKIKVVVMDTTVDWAHPNLADAINLEDMRDFSARDTAEKIVRPVKGRPPVEAKDGDRITTPTIYGAHGTCVAGLIGARPVMVNLQYPDRPDENTDGMPSAVSKVPLPYIGINPFCEIVPVALTAAPDPAMVKAALDYISQIKPQIVVVAAAWDHARYQMSAKGAEPVMGKSFSEEEPDWTVVEDALREVCTTSLVFCAAGNSGADAMAYPARLSGKIPNLIAVTACNQDGDILNYAFDPASLPEADKSRPVIMRTLSSDHPRYDRDTAYLDPYAAVDPYLKIPAGSSKFPARRIISCDPRGNRGYNPSKYRYTPPTSGPHLELASLYAEFSGTSAATAIAAGLVALGMQVKGITDIKKVDVQKLQTQGMFGIEDAIAAIP